MEPVIGNQPMGKKKTARFDRPVSITLHSHRKRLCDEAGISEKYVIDSLVAAGILQDDSPRWVKKIDHIQVKSKEEKTIIIIEEI